MNPAENRKPVIALVLTAGGSSTRMTGVGKKELFILGESTVLKKAYDEFKDTGLFSIFAVTYQKAFFNETKKALCFADAKAARNNSADRKVIFVEGGSTRQESVLRALEALSKEHPDYVLIHDGARPWVDREIILSVVDETLRSGASAPYIIPVDAMKELAENGTISAHFGRGTLACIQTPQGFRFTEILEAHRKALQDGFSVLDDTEIYSRYIGKVTAVKGKPQNRKITFSFDLEGV